MKSMVLFTAFVWAGASLPAQTVSGQTDREERMHVETSFDLVVHATYAETATLFGPEGERPWAGEGWNPHFIYPVPAQDVAGAVFTVPHGPHTAVWVTTGHDLAARHFQYAYFVAGLMVTTIDVTFNPADAKTTSVHVTYARTSLSAEGDAHVVKMTEVDKNAARNWQEAIDRYLESRALLTK